ncbi:MAG TPA: RluA family pseudouridine synthase [Candidatus Fimicola cottocaccae]|nr:RluA family pseudouridine synthase [Candidatus Fimicola cottocaccae]
MKEIKITEKEQNQRLDKYLLKYFNKAPKSFIYKMLRKKRIKYNGKKAEGGEILSSGDSLQLYLADETMAGFMEEKTINKAERRFGIVYEDENVIFVSKPAGVLTHPEKESDKNTLIDQILYYLYEKGEYEPSASSVFTPAVCNRLDRNTSGIIIAGKNLMAVQELNRAVLEHKIDKRYIALVKGGLKAKGELTAYIKKDGNRNISSVMNKEVEGGKKILTKYNVINSVKEYDLVEIELITGKSHQIRAQFSAMGNPLVGDRKYGNENINRYFRINYGLNNQFLHAYKLIVNINDGGLSYLSGREFVSPLPEPFSTIKKDIFG